MHQETTQPVAVQENVLVQEGTLYRTRGANVQRQP